jgi:NAD(P)-dependent dehydrogenase (short-subunit alcohol dehydrogenase family)
MSNKYHISQEEVAVVTGSSTGMGLEVEQAFIALFVNASRRF